MHKSKQTITPNLVRKNATYSCYNQMDSPGYAWTKKRTQKALHNEKKLLQGIAACEYCCHDNSSGYDFKCRCIRAGVHLLCVHCLLTRMDAQFCFCATKMCVCAVHSQTSRDCDCIFHTAGYPGEQPFCFALLPCRGKNGNTPLVMRWLRNKLS